MLFAVIDTETTGLPFHPEAALDLQPRIIEFGGFITDGKEIMDELSFICNPGIVIEAIITQITGLTNEKLKDQPPFRHFIPQLADFFAKAEGRIAHNLSFDKGMLQYDLRRRDLTLDDINWNPAIEICTVEQTYHQFGRRMKLETLYNRFCGEYKQKHEALDDCRMLHELCQEIGVYSSFALQPE